MNGTEAESLPPALEHLDDLAPALAHRQPVLFLDYDGTLTPIVKHPEDAILSEDMRQVLRELASLCTVSLVSGRDRAQVEQMVGLQGLVYAGSHGFDIAGPEGLHLQHEGGQQALPDLDEAEVELRKRLADIPGAQVERKRFALAVHYRNAPEEELPRLRKIVQEIASRHDRLKPAGGKKIIELKPNISWDKGQALLWLLDRLKLHRDQVLPFYLGDDLTDEDAFRVLTDQGIGILVGDHGHPTQARYRLRNVPEVQQFLQRLLQLLRKRPRT